MNGRIWLWRYLEIMGVTVGALLAGVDSPRLAAQDTGASTSFHLTSTDAFSAGTIIGVLYDVGSGLGVKDALVSIDGTSIGTVTDELGRFTLRGATPGSSTLVVEKVGFERVRTTIMLEEGRALAVAAGIAQVRIPLCGLVICQSPFGCYAVEAVVRDIVTGVAPQAEVTLRVLGSVASDSVSMQAGPGQESLHMGAGAEMVNAGPLNDRGPYEVEVTASGYEAWRRSEVRRDACNMVPGWLRVWLVPGR
jgi:hypothetical protein